MPEEKQLSATFSKEKETKNTIRFAEDVDNEAPIVGTIYVQKYALNRLSNPSKIKVTIEAA